MVEGKVKGGEWERRKTLDGREKVWEGGGGGGGRKKGEGLGKGKK